ncbi:SPOR domain-containing protein [Sulfurimonas sp.]|uniref:SPOR domain-containing protein n=1 Tax=Sulfurimonas sp. TaxID=2022749 RepID=UPI00261E3847|nr:SPOR domain-containing protein [Sulfurimonas sp.]
MEDKNELSDIVLNKSGSSNSNKKIILAIATLGVVLIVVVMLMNSINSNGTNNLPQAVIPPEPKAQQTANTELEKEPLFEEVEVIQDNETPSQELDKVVQKLKEQSSDNTEVTQTVMTPVKKVHKKEVAVTHTATKPMKKAKTPTQKSGVYFIQVGSFSKYTPNKKFLNSISNLGYKYSYHKVKNVNKVLVGPFNSLKDANNAKKVLRSKVEPGAFLVKL